jgi:co-chaperonin GroES (HSP10)
METMTPVVPPLTPVRAPAVRGDGGIDQTMKPAGYRILVEILPTQETLKRWKDSELVMPPETRDREWAAQVCAVALRLGPDAYMDRAKFPTGPWCREGDHILMRPYSGTRFMVRGRLYALINDDTVQAVIGDASEIERA